MNTVRVTIPSSTADRIAMILFMAFFGLMAVAAVIGLSLSTLRHANKWTWAVAILALLWWAWPAKADPVLDAAVGAEIAQMDADAARAEWEVEQQYLWLRFEKCLNYEQYTVGMPYSVAVSYCDYKLRTGTL